MTDAPSVPQVVYVAGHARSGSTVLGMLLGLTQGAVMTGELATIFDRWLQGDQVCSCGAVLEGCPFWSSVMREFSTMLPLVTVERAATVTHAVDQLGWKARTRRKQDLREYQQIWKAMLRSIASVSGADIIVDTSKTAHACSYRPHALGTITKTCAVLLVRDPRAVMASVRKAGTRKRVAKSFPAIRTVLSWSWTYLNAASLTKDSSLVLSTLRYESLTAQPLVELARMAAELGLDLSPAEAAVMQLRPINARHVFDGNALRRDQVVFRTQSQDWLAGVTRTERWLAILSAPFASRYGYRVV